MAITENTSIDQTVIEENGVVLYREATRVFRDEVEIAKTYHRTRLVPGQDLTGVPQSVVDICNIVWTQDVIDAYIASIPAPKTEAA